MNINDKRRRYSQLVDKQFSSGLTAEEVLEKRRLENEIDEHEARLFRPLYKWLNKKINQAQRSHLERIKQ